MYCVRWSHKPQKNIMTVPRLRVLKKLCRSMSCYWCSGPHTIRSFKILYSVCFSQLYLCQILLSCFRRRKNNTQNGTTGLQRYLHYIQFFVGWPDFHSTSFTQFNAQQILSKAIILALMYDRNIKWAPFLPHDNSFPKPSMLLHLISRFHIQLYQKHCNNVSWQFH